MCPRRTESFRRRGEDGEVRRTNHELLSEYRDTSSNPLYTPFRVVSSLREQCSAAGLHRQDLRICRRSPAPVFSYEQTLVDDGRRSEEYRDRWRPWTGWVPVKTDWTCPRHSSVGRGDCDRTRSPRLKVWETTDSPKLLVIGRYRMGFEIAPQGSDSRFRVFIDYALPETTPAGWLGHLLGRTYAKWCTHQMVDDVVADFASSGQNLNG
jgi:hypothetical protein